MNSLGYLCSEFPALSHTFISREIAVLEKEGLRIHTSSVNSPKHLEEMGDDDRARAAQTYCIKATPRSRIVLTCLAYFIRLPSFCSVLRYSLRVNWRSGPKDLAKSLAYFLEAILLDAWARREGIAHVHVHFANSAATVALLASRFGRITYSLSVHGPDEFYEVERNNLREKISMAVFVRCIGYFCRSQLMRLTSPDQWAKFHIIRCGLYRDEFEFRPAKVGSLHSILCVGRICPSKGQAILVEAAGILAAKGLEFHVLFLGGGDDFENVKRLADKRGLASRVTMAGPVGHARVKAELTKADIFVLPSFAEGIPVALMEAMASGIPVVSTAIAGIPELISDGRDGFLTNASDVDRLAETLEALLSGRVNTESMTECAREKVRLLYDVEINTKMLGRVFSEL